MFIRLADFIQNKFEYLEESLMMQAQRNEKQ